MDDRHGRKSKLGPQDNVSIVLPLSHWGCLKVGRPSPADRRYPELAYGDSTDKSYQFITENEFQCKAILNIATMI